MIILASTSPRRRDLLGRLGIAFRAINAAVEERPPRSGEPVEDYTRALAVQKAEAGARLEPGAVIVAADTEVVLDGVILGKPLDAEHARRMLLSLRGRSHNVATSVAVHCGGTTSVMTKTARVKMRNYTDAEVDRYVLSGEPMDKAGAYAVQEYGGTLVESVAGCYNAVVGLPLCLTADLLGRCLPDLAIERVECPHHDA